VVRIHSGVFRSGGSSGVDRIPVGGPSPGRPQTFKLVRSSFFARHGLGLNRPALARSAPCPPLPGIVPDSPSRGGATELEGAGLPAGRPAPACGVLRWSGSPGAPGVAPDSPPCKGGTGGVDSEQGAPGDDGPNPVNLAYGLSMQTSREPHQRRSNWSKPEPDLAVVRGQAEDYIDRDVIAADIAVVVEIAESSLSADQEDMALIYASSAILVCWIIILVDRCVEVYSDPGLASYRSCERLIAGQEVRVVVEDVDVGRIAVADLLP
jgi:hypothetical protein